MKTMSDTRFTPHLGGGFPRIAGNPRVEIQTMNGDTYEGRLHDWTMNWQWTQANADNPYCIIGYRILE